MQSALPEKSHSSCDSRLTCDSLVREDADGEVQTERASVPHETEYVIQRALLNMPDVYFSSLEIHRLPDGVCLTGVVRVQEGLSPNDLERVASTAAGVTKVLNRIVVCSKVPPANEE